MAIRWTKDIIYDEAYPENCRLEICEPADIENPPLLIYFHGGGLEAGKYHIGPNLTALAETYGVAVASAEYRMYPSARFPEFVEDAAKAVAWVLNVWKAREKYSGVYVGGSSAGGYLSMMLCLAEDFLKDAGADARLIDGYVLDAGQPTTHYNILRERGMDTRLVRVDEAAPLWYVDRSYKERYTPDLLIIAADHDMVNRMEQNVMFHTALRHMDYPEDRMEFRLMKGFRHCGYCGYQDEKGVYVFAEMIAAFIRRCQERRNMVS